MANEYPTGWAMESEDTSYLRDQGIVFSSPGLLAEPPDEFDTRQIITVEDQQQTSSCVGHGTSSMMEACAWIAAANTSNFVAPEQFSRWYAYLVAQKESGLFGRDQGATISGAIQAMKSGGCCRESTLPFPGRYVTRIPREATAEAANFKIRSHTSLRDYSSVFNFMANGFGGIDIGITWTSRLANNRGVVELADVKGGGGGHCVLLWGWSKRVDSSGRHYLWLHNSHSKAYANGGRTEVAPGVIDFWGQGRSSELIGGSDLTGFDKPRRIVPDITQMM